MEMLFIICAGGAFVVVAIVGGIFELFRLYRTHREAKKRRERIREACAIRMALLDILR